MIMPHLHTTTGSATTSEHMVNHGDYKPIADENKDVSLATLPTNISNNNNREDMCFVKIRSVEGLCSQSKLPHGEYITFTCGRPSRLPSSVNVLLWGGFSGYCQELLRQHSRRSWLALIVIVFIPLVLVTCLPFLGYDSTSGVYLWSQTLLMWFIVIILPFVSNAISYKFDTDMDRIVSTKLGPVFRSQGRCELCYFSGRSMCSSYAYFTIQKLPNCTEEEQPIYESILMNLDDDDFQFGSLTSFLNTNFNVKKDIPRNEMLVPVFGTKYYNRSLEMSERPKDLHVNMFVWGMIVECFQKVELSPRTRQQVKAMRIMAFTWLTILFASLMIFYSMELAFDVYWIVMLLGYCFCYNFSWFFAILIEPYPSAEELHQEYEHALDEIAPIIEQHSMYRVEYMITNNGRSGQLLFRLKQHQQQDNLAATTTTGTSNSAMV